MPRSSSASVRNLLFAVSTLALARRKDWPMTELFVTELLDCFGTETLASF